MSTIAINLVPAPRRISRRRQTLIKRWVTATCIYSALLVVLVVIFQALAGTAVHNVDQDIARVESDIEATRKQISEVAPLLIESRLTLQASQAVDNQADWSVLLALLTSRLNDRVVLSSCSLTPMTPTGATAAPTVPRVGGGPVQVATNASPGAKAGKQLRLDVRGLAQAQAALSAFVLELEQTKLFEKVVLQDAQRVEFRKGDAIQFQVICHLREGGTTP